MLCTWLPTSHVKLGYLLISLWVYAWYVCNIFLFCSSVILSYIRTCIMPTEIYQMTWSVCWYSYVGHHENKQCYTKFFNSVSKIMYFSSMLFYFIFPFNNNNNNNIHHNKLETKTRIKKIYYLLCYKYF